MNDKPANSGPRVLGVFTLAMINVAAICSLKNLTLGSEYGLGMLFFYGAIAVVFFIPMSLVSAELATGWPENGGVYVWAREAFGPRWGFMAIWLQWVNNFFWFPTALAFIAAALAYVFNPALAQNKFFVLAVVLVVFWAATLANLRGMKVSGMISSVGAIIGTLIPGALVILLGIIWLAMGKPSAISLEVGALIPDMSQFKQIAFLAGVILAVAGMEMSAVHAQDVKNPKKNYPKAILLSAVLIFVLYILGSMAIAVVVPAKEMSLVAGLMQAFAAMFKEEHLEWATPVVAFLIVAGSIASVSTWLVGPAKGIYATARTGDLPPILQKVNRAGVPVNILILQAVLVSLVSLAMLLMPTVSSAYWMFAVVTAQLYIMMYMILFAAAIRLRYTKPDVERAYRIPWGNTGMWLVAGLGAAACLFAFAFGFVPPPDVQSGSVTFFESFLVLGILIMGSAPFVIARFRKPHWKLESETED